MISVHLFFIFFWWQSLCWLWDPGLESVHSWSGARQGFLHTGDIGAMPETLAVNSIGPGIMGSIVLGALCVGTQPGNSCVRWIFSLAVRRTTSRPFSKGQLWSSPIHSYAPSLPLHHLSSPHFWYPIFPLGLVWKALEIFPHKQANSKELFSRKNPRQVIEVSYCNIYETAFFIFCCNLFIYCRMSLYYWPALYIKLDIHYKFVVLYQLTIQCCVATLIYLIAFFFAKSKIIIQL